MKVNNLKVYWNYPGGNVTNCYIEDLQGCRLASGQSRVHHTDKWNKWKGRKVSFQKAVENIPSREIRATLWNALLKESPKTFKFGK